MIVVFRAPHTKPCDAKNAMDIAIPLIPGWHVSLFSPWLIGAIVLLIVLGVVLLARAPVSRES